MTESELFEINESQMQKAIDLLYDTFQVNNVPVAIGTNACLNVVVQMLVSHRLSKDHAFELAGHFKKALLSMGVTAVVMDKESP